MSRCWLISLMSIFLLGSLPHAAGETGTPARYDRGTETGQQPGTAEPGQSPRNVLGTESADTRCAPEAEGIGTQSPALLSTKGAAQPLSTCMARSERGPRARRTPNTPFGAAPVLTHTGAEATAAPQTLPPAGSGTSRPHAA